MKTKIEIQTEQKQTTMETKMNLQTETENEFEIGNEMQIWKGGIKSLRDEENSKK